MNIYSDDEDYKDYDNSDDIYCEDDYFDEKQGSECPFGVNCFECSLSDECF